jgi:hypothetical protein
MTVTRRQRTPTPTNPEAETWLRAVARKEPPPQSPPVPKPPAPKAPQGVRGGPGSALAPPLDIDAAIRDRVDEQRGGWHRLTP